jgi:hypothetical protein
MRAFHVRALFPMVGVHLQQLVSALEEAEKGI